MARDHAREHLLRWSKYTPEQKETIRNQAIERKRAKKIKAIEYKGGKCVRCGGVFPPRVYDFHHLDPSNKITWSCVFLGWNWERIKTELDKCILLCANCHRLEHNKEEDRAISRKQNRSRQPKRS